MDSRYEALLKQPCPRPVRLSKRGRSSVKVLIAALVVVEIWILAAIYLRSSQFRQIADFWRTSALFVCAALALPLLALTYAPILKRQRALLSGGRVAVALVTSTYRINNRGPLYVKYKFQDEKGCLIERDSLDSTNLLREGSSMFVYYDTDDLDGQVAQCAAYYEIVVPGFRSDYVDEAG